MGSHAHACATRPPGCRRVKLVEVGTTAQTVDDYVDATHVERDGRGRRRPDRWGSGEAQDHRRRDDHGAGGTHVDQFRTGERFTIRMDFDFASGSTSRCSGWPSTTLEGVYLWAFEHAGTATSCPIRSRAPGSDRVIGPAADAAAGHLRGDGLDRRLLDHPHLRLSPALHPLRRRPRHPAGIRRSGGAGRRLGQPHRHGGPTSSGAMRQRAQHRHRRQLRRRTRTTEQPRHDDDRRPGVVSVVLVNFRGADDTITCIAALRRARLAGRPAGDRLSSRTPPATTVPPASAPPTRMSCSSNRRRTPGSPAAAISASRTPTGEFVAFLNNDARPDPHWITGRGRDASTRPRHRLRSRPRCSTGTASWSTSSTAAHLVRHGLQAARSSARPRRLRHARDVLFGTGAAMFVRAEVFDAGRRLRRALLHVLRGRRPRLAAEPARLDGAVRAALAGLPQAPRVDEEVRHLPRDLPARAERAVHACTRTSTTRSLAQAFPAALALAVRRVVARVVIDATELDLRHAPGGDDVDRIEVSKNTLAGIYAIDQFVEQMPTLINDRKHLQATPDRVGRRCCCRCFGKRSNRPTAIPTTWPDTRTWSRRSASRSMFSRRRRIIIITGEPLANAHGRAGDPVVEHRRVLSTGARGPAAHLRAPARRRRPTSTCASRSPAAICTSRAGAT